MKPFNYYQPTEILFGAGRSREVGKAVARYGKRCLLVTTKTSTRSRDLYQRVMADLEAAGVAAAHFQGVTPNPTTDVVTAGARTAREHRADVILGLGGGSSMDCAKAIAVEAMHPGTAWDYLFFKAEPTARTLPVVAVTTTSGTGSQVTQVAVITKTAERSKSALYHPRLYPRVAIVDPELMVGAPAHLTACTGWDAFTHAFESYLHRNASPYTDMMALTAMELVARWLPTAVRNGSDLAARSGLAWADTLAGLCIANAGVTLPHGMGMAISGLYPHVAHGEALAAAYPAVLRYTWRSAVERFAAAGRRIDPRLAGSSDQAAAEACCGLIERLLREVGLWVSLKGLKVPKAELPELAKACLVLPDYQNNPRVATLPEVAELLDQAFAQ